MKVKVIGGGFAGCEACHQLLKRGVDVTLAEMKPLKKSPAHHLDTLCEVVCSNSFKSEDFNTSSGVLKEEMKLLDSLVLQVAQQTRVPAGNALAVDRNAFSSLITQRLEAFENIRRVAEVCDTLDTDGLYCVQKGMYLALINARPKKVLSYASPQDLFYSFFCRCCT